MCQWFNKFPEFNEKFWSIQKNSNEFKHVQGLGVPVWLGVGGVGVWG